MTLKINIYLPFFIVSILYVCFCVSGEILWLFAQEWMSFGSAVDNNSVGGTFRRQQGASKLRPPANNQLVLWPAFLSLQIEHLQSLSLPLFPKLQPFSGSDP